MKRNEIIETAYRTISSVLEWGFKEKGDVLYGFIDGVVSMTDALLEDAEELEEAKYGFVVDATSCDDTNFSS